MRDDRTWWQVAYEILVVWSLEFGEMGREISKSLEGVMDAETHEEQSRRRLKLDSTGSSYVLRETPLLIL